MNLWGYRLAELTERDTSEWMNERDTSEWMNERDTSEWMNESFISQDIYIFTGEINMFYIRHTVYTTSYLTKHKLVNKINKYKHTAYFSCT